MESPTPRWSLLGTSTNDHGVTHFTLSCQGFTAPYGDYDELIQVLTSQYGAVDAGELAGPYSFHKYLEVGGLRIGVIMEWPDWLDLYVVEKADVPAMESLVSRLLDTLNG
jgi:hypothetical protein